MLINKIESFIPNKMLTPRQGKILGSIVKEYTMTAIPVSSGAIVRKYYVDYSTATVRNEMLELEDKGYLLKPHVSAGRIPSDKGYRYFVDNLLKFKEMKESDQKKLQVDLLKLKAQNTRLSKMLAKLLSTTSQCLAVSGIVEKDEYYDFGMHTLLDDPDFKQLDEVSKISASLDMLDEKVAALMEQLGEGETRIFIGKENPIKEIRNASMIVSPYILESGERGLVAIIGPKRMHYGENKTLIDFVKSILGRKELVVLGVLGNVSMFVIRP